MAPLNTMTGFLMAALFLVPTLGGAVAAAVGAADDCNKGCARYEKTDFRQFLECSDFCAFEADYKAMYEGLEACKKACDAVPGGSGASPSSCKDVCAVKVDDVADVIATRACYRDCARGGDPAAKKTCEASCDRRGERGVAFVEKDAVARLDVCFKRCEREQGGEDVRRANACKEACPLVRFAKDKLLIGKEETNAARP